MYSNVASLNNWRKARGFSKLLNYKKKPIGLLSINKTNQSKIFY